MDEMFNYLGVILKRYLFSKTTENLSGKGANELRHSVKY